MQRIGLLRSGFQYRPRGEVADRRVRTAGIAVVRPPGRLFSGMPEVEEQALVQQLVANPAVEGIHEPVLPWLGKEESTGFKALWPIPGV